MARPQHGPTQAVWWAVTINSHDPQRLATFWSSLLGRAISEPGPDRPGWYRLDADPAGAPLINFQPVASTQGSGQPLHLDLLVADVDAAATWAQRLGAEDTGRRESLPRGEIAVMRDPDGNEFCLLSPPKA